MTHDGVVVQLDAASSFASADLDLEAVHYRSGRPLRAQWLEKLIVNMKTTVCSSPSALVLYLLWYW